MDFWEARTVLKIKLPEQFYFQNCPTRQTQSCESRIKNRTPLKLGLTLLSNSINEGRPLEIDSQIDKLMLALAKLLSGKICDMIEADEDAEKGVDLLLRSLCAIDKILKIKKYSKVITSPSVHNLLSGCLSEGMKFAFKRTKLLS